MNMKFNEVNRTVTRTPDYFRTDDFDCSKEHLLEQIANRAEHGDVYE